MSIRGEWLAAILMVILAILLAVTLINHLEVLRKENLDALSRY